MGQDRKVETLDRAYDLDGLVFSTRNNAIVHETDIEAFIRAGSPESSPETEADFIPFDYMDEASVPHSSLGCLRRLYKYFVADQHAGSTLRETGDRKANESVNV